MKSYFNFSRKYLCTLKIICPRHKGFAQESVLIGRLIWPTTAEAKAFHRWPLDSRPPSYRSRPPSARPPINKHHTLPSKRTFQLQQFFVSLQSTISQHQSHNIDLTSLGCCVKGASSSYPYASHNGTYPNSPCHRPWVIATRDAQNLQLLRNSLTAIIRAPLPCVGSPLTMPLSIPRICLRITSSIPQAHPHRFPTTLHNSIYFLPGRVGLHTLKACGNFISQFQRTIPNPRQRHSSARGYGIPMLRKRVAVSV